MKKKTVTLLCALTICLAQANIALADPPDLTEESEKSNTGTYLRVGGLCMGGAIVGSFVPIFGNIAGCAIGALGGWFWPGSKEKTESPTRIVLDQ